VQRLVYTPRAYVFTKDASGNIRDVSRYVTGGTISRKTGQVSSANITLRNPKRIFTTPDENGTTAFSPMDPITIYLKRLRGRPVRAFTGFLDRAPFWQMYPGIITLEASCTLKRLLHTYFDPALPYTQSFLAAYGWIPDPKNPGQWFNLNGLNDWKRSADEDAKEYEKLTGKRLPDDGSIAQLLYATMKHIGNWKDRDIYIETLPKDLFERLAELAKQFEDDADATRKEFNELMRRIIGEGSYGDGDNNVDLSGIDGSVAEQVYKVGRELRVPHKHLLAAFMTGIVESHFHNLSGGDADSAGWRQERASLYPDPTNVVNSAKRFYAECKQLDHGQTAGELAADVQRPRADLRGRYAEVRDQAVTLLRKTENNVEKDDRDASAVPGQAMDPDRSNPDRHKRSQTKGGTTKGDSHGKWGYPLAEKAQNLGGVAAHKSRPLHNWESDNAVDLGAPPGTAWLAVEDGVISASLGWGDSSGSGHSTVYGYRLHLVGDSGNTYFYQHGASNIAPKGKRVSKGDKIGEIGDYRANGIPSHLHFAAQNVNPETVIKEAGITLGDDATGGDSGGSGGEPDIMAAGAASAFFGAINFPSMMESLEAVSLGGEKSLMNDKPLLPFIQQLCEAGLREFQSLPDGKFFAFYPDYFGEMFHRKPYWEIDDIEVLDGKIELSDDALITHYYVVGDTTMAGQMGGSDSTRLNSMFSSGVVTIFNAFLADSLIDRKPVNADKGKKDGPKPIKDKNDTRGMEFVMKKDEAIQFLQRYGARPSVDYMPMIKHPYFEMFLAYQRFLLAWSKQFLTTFTFTFMPELYPGGKVGFPDHGLQMYIDEVTHTWDYESGFMTQANLSAPSRYGATNDYLPPNMVKALVTAGGK
jgi:murein DD-endopeptidase MepM/ murein hydrolase activator NlpD